MGASWPLRLPSGSGKASHCEEQAVQLPQAPHLDRCFPGCQRAESAKRELTVEWVGPCGDWQQSVQPGGRLAKSKRQNWSLTRSGKRQLEGRGRAAEAGALSSPLQSTKAAQQLPQHINSLLHLVDLARLEVITCKRSSFTNVAVHWSCILQGWALPGLLPAEQSKAPANPQRGWVPAPRFTKQQQKGLRGRCSGGNAAL